MLNADAECATLKLLLQRLPRGQRSLRVVGVQARHTSSVSNNKLNAIILKWSMMEVAGGREKHTSKPAFAKMATGANTCAHVKAG